MLPTMANHGCPPEYHTTNIKADGTHIEKCTSCDYTITHDRPSGDSSALPSARPRHPDRITR